jgi:flagellar hook protein FlgE
VNQSFSQGNISTTNNPLDLAINGAGFFRTETNGAVGYTRDGQFQVDKSGYLVNAQGARVTGYAADASGQIAVGTPVDLKLSSGDGTPAATQTATLGMNLNAQDAVPSTPFSTADATSYTGATSLTVYDAQGNSHSLSLYFAKSASDNWNVYATQDGASASVAGGATPIGTLTFDSSGKLTSGATPFSMNLKSGDGTTQPIKVDLSAATQFGSNFAVSSIKQDGYATGQLVGFGVDNSGTITARYTNGQTITQGQVVLATFANPQGLSAQSGNSWTETSSSGPATLGAPGSSTLGTLQSGAVEESNIDLTTELVSLITAQRDYQANAQTIKTQDQVMQTIVNIQ